MDSSRRNFGLDLTRAIAISAVVWAHSLRSLKLGFGERVPGLFPVDGVSVFFVLSGFLIGRIIFRSVEGKTPSELFAFYKRRWWRTLPNYYLFLLLHIAAYIALGISEKIDWRTLVFLQNINLPNTLFFRESWSLAVEEWFYILFPLLWFLALRLGLWHTTRSFFFLILGILVLATVSKAIYFNAIQTGDPFAMHPGLSRLTVVHRMSSILWGVSMAALFIHRPQVRRKPILFATAAVLTIVFGHWALKELGGYWYRVFIYDLHSISVALLFPLILRIPAPTGGTFLWIGRFITKMSQFSYSAYLINLPLLSLCAWWIQRDHLNSKTTVALAVLFAYVLLWFSSALVYRKFEKPLTDRRDR